MCGLFGVIRPGGVLKVDDDVLAKLGAQLLHRGPDGSGYIRDGQALLGMHRLSIMDPAHGWQPFWSEDQRWGVLGNGEIYNASSLREHLKIKGHTFATRSDIEVVPHMMEEFGNDTFIRLRGMFALVIIDRRNDNILLVRDRMGEKPLCLFSNGDTILLSSEQSTFVRAGVVPLTLDNDQLPHYLLHGFTPEPDSLIKGVRKVPAAHFMTIGLADGDISETRYWDPLDEVGNRPLSNPDIALAIENAVVATCTSDVPVGIALSGGLDSSLVAAIASKTRTDLSAFTIGYSTRSPDESSLAQGLAAHLGIECHTSILDTDKIARDFAGVCAARDEPISDIAGPALAALPQAARAAGVPVLLTGIGGDELFWGYDWTRQLAVWTSNYLENRMQGRNVRRPRFSPIPRVRQAQVDWITAVGGLIQDSQMRAFMSQNVREGLAPLPFYEFQPGYRSVSRAVKELVGLPKKPQTAEFFGRADPAWVGAFYTIASNDTYLRVNSLVQVDRLAMTYSIESRTPLADADLTTTILSGRLSNRDQFLPPKSRLREIARDYLPAEIVNRPKRGFTPPVREWIRAIWQANRDALSGEAIISNTRLNPEYVQSWMSSPTDHSGRINQIALRLLTLELWLRSLE
jgi:asparagine synthase (glutamine-hydrolysing)